MSAPHAIVSHPRFVMLSRHLDGFHLIMFTADDRALSWYGASVRECVEKFEESERDQRGAA